MLFFFYGSLRTPRLAPPSIARWLQGARLVGRGRVRGRLHDLGPYPAATLDAAATSWIIGDVHELPDDPAITQALDDYEGFVPARPEGSLYRRVQATVALDDGRGLTCWMYVSDADRTECPFIADGDYDAWKSQRAPAVG